MNVFLIEGPIKFNVFMAALLTWTALIIAGVIYWKMGDLPDWLIAIVFTSFGYWLPSPNKQTEVIETLEKPKVSVISQNGK